PQFVPECFGQRAAGVRLDGAGHSVDGEGGLLHAAYFQIELRRCQVTAEICTAGGHRTPASRATCGYSDLHRTSPTRRGRLRDGSSWAVGGPRCRTPRRPPLPAPARRPPTSPASTTTCSAARTTTPPTARSAPPSRRPPPRSTSGCSSSGPYCAGRC